jgi:hypothetical protein
LNGKFRLIRLIRKSIGDQGISCHRHPMSHLRLKGGFNREKPIAMVLNAKTDIQEGSAEQGMLLGISSDIRPRACPIQGRCDE